MDAEAIYKGVRPSDLRFENVHQLAEFIAQAQRLVDTAMTTDVASKQMLAGALTISREGVARLQKAQAAFDASVESKGGALVDQLSDVRDSLRDAGVDLIMKSGEAIQSQAQSLASAAQRLEDAASAAEAKRLEASDARVKLLDYEVELNVYEVEVMRRCRDAMARRGLWGRVMEVFAPASRLVDVPKAPARPGAHQSQLGAKKAAPRERNN